MHTHLDYMINIINRQQPYKGTTMYEFIKEAQQCFPFVTYDKKYELFLVVYVVYG